MSDIVSVQADASAKYRAEREPKALLSRLSEIISLADSEKEALSFLPPTAYREAIEKRRLVGMFNISNGETKLVGYVLFSGVYPNAKIQQIVVNNNHRRGRVATSLLNEVISQLEVEGYLTVTAAVASDLRGAQAFYERNGFVAKRSREGGKARKRQIILRARDLQTPSLFSLLEPTRAVSKGMEDLGLRHRGAGQAPLYAIDLNVLFDITKQPPRPRAPFAEKLITAALSHKVRLVIAPEFIAELKRKCEDPDVDPILRLALQLPRLPVVDAENADRIAKRLHQLIFEEPGLASAGTPQAQSDARHLAEAALASAAAYVTSDGSILDVRREILQEIGVDVCSLEEFAELLPGELSSGIPTNVKKTDVSMRDVSAELLRKHLLGRELEPELLSEFAPTVADPSRWSGRAVFEGDDIVAVGVYIYPPYIHTPTRILVHVRPDHVAANRFADHLLDEGVRRASTAGPITIELPWVPGQTTVRQLAMLRGFVPNEDRGVLIKGAIGRPVTRSSWDKLSRQLRRTTALHLPEDPPILQSARTGVSVSNPEGEKFSIPLEVLEDALGPTLVLLPGRDGVIVPITRGFADDLLNTGDQMPLFGEPIAAFLSQRTYFNTPRAARLMRPRTPILFYESKRSGGRGNIIAAARIVDSMVLMKNQVPKDLYTSAVVEDLSTLTKASDILVTTFDNLLRFPQQVSLEQLRAMKAIGRSNLQTATALSSTLLCEIVEMGWE